MYSFVLVLFLVCFVLLFFSFFLYYSISCFSFSSSFFLLFFALFSCTLNSTFHYFLFPFYFLFLYSSALLPFYFSFLLTSYCSTSFLLPFYLLLSSFLLPSFPLSFFPISSLLSSFLLFLFFCLHCPFFVYFSSSSFPLPTQRYPLLPRPFMLLLVLLYLLPYTFSCLSPLFLSFTLFSFILFLLPPSFHLPSLYSYISLSFFLPFPFPASLLFLLFCTYFLS